MEEVKENPGEPGSEDLSHRQRKSRFPETQVEKQQDQIEEAVPRLSGHPRELTDKNGGKAAGGGSKDKMGDGACYWEINKGKTPEEVRKDDRCPELTQGRETEGASGLPPEEVCPVP